MTAGSAFHDLWMADDTPRMILVGLDGAGPLGDPYQVNSANHGPYGDAVTRKAKRGQNYLLERPKGVRTIYLKYIDQSGNLVPCRDSLGGRLQWRW